MTLVTNGPDPEPDASPDAGLEPTDKKRYLISDEAERAAGIAAAASAIQSGELIVLPTDTVYGIAADAFSPAAVANLLVSKGRGREMPPPVLVSEATTLDALATNIPTYARALVDELWPGPLTLVCHQQPSLQWDLGDTRGTVAVRMPDNDVALEVLSRTGPLAVSSANTSGLPAARTADIAESMLGPYVAVILDGGPTPGPEPSTIVDVTGPQGRVLRLGVVPLERLNEIVAPTGVTIVDEG